MLVIPSTKQMASRMLDLPLPLRPVIELKLSSLNCRDTFFVISKTADKDKTVRYTQLSPLHPDGGAQLTSPR